MQYFFVGGAPKSGTTWLQKAIDLHPNAVCSGEGHFHEYILTPMANMLGSYNKKLQHVSRMVYQNDPSYPPISRDMVVSLTRHIVIELMLRRCNSNTMAVGDKTPKHTLVLNDLNVLFPELRFIFAIRDPRDVAASRLHHAFRELGPEALDSRSKLYREVVYASSQDWDVALKRADNFASRNPNRVLFVRYEDLIADNRQQLARIFAFIAVPTTHSQLDSIVKQSSFEVLSGRKPGVEDKTSFYRKGVQGDWPSVLDANAVDTILSACAPGMKAMGYSE